MAISGQRDLGATDLEATLPAMRPFISFQWMIAEFQHISRGKLDIFCPARCPPLRTSSIFVNRSCRFGWLVDNSSPVHLVVTGRATMTSLKSDARKVRTLAGLAIVAGLAAGTASSAAEQALFKSRRLTPPSEYTRHIEGPAVDAAGILVCAEFQDRWNNRQAEAGCDTIGAVRRASDGQHRQWNSLRSRRADVRR